MRMSKCSYTFKLLFSIFGFLNKNFRPFQFRFLFVQLSGSTSKELRAKMTAIIAELLDDLIILIIKMTSAI